MDAAGNTDGGGAASSFEPQESNEFGRGISFFDAIYGFAITLLIANVDAPHPAAWVDFDALVDSGVLSQLLGLTLSFIVIAVFWRVNVRVMKRLRGLDPATTFLNLVAVGFVILIPFTTQGISDPESAQYMLPTAMYAVNIALVSIAQLLLFEVARARGLERERTTARENTLHMADTLVTPVVFLASIPIGLLFGTDAAKWSWLSLVVLSPMAGTLAARAAKRAS